MYIYFPLSKLGLLLKNLKILSNFITKQPPNLSYLSSTTGNKMAWNVWVFLQPVLWFFVISQQELRIFKVLILWKSYESFFGYQVITTYKTNKNERWTIASIQVEYGSMNVLVVLVVIYKIISLKKNIPLCITFKGFSKNIASRKNGARVKLHDFLL